jgi:L-cysteine:1D-myo-inositol 2-amino-2-deoxy-alpha-D-glucopyranoside ligase
MQSWTAPVVPKLPGTGPELSLWDTASRRVLPTEPGPVARIYVCGITPYDATHLGHAATYVAFDLVNRAWQDSGHEVLYVQNVTDVDDPLLERAIRDGVDWRGLAQDQIELFREDMAALQVIPPAHYIGAVEAMPGIIELIELLRDKGAAYEVDADLYFPVSADPEFGRVAGLDQQTMMALSAERGGDPDRPGKKDPLDCLLWLGERPGDPSWDSPFGPGRPGWHVECTAIALTYLGRQIDVQGGGSDLAFPHHEMSSSEAVVATGASPFARHFVHAGMVGYQGEKMSKSRGNLVFVSALRRAGVDPAAIRLTLLAHHYRSDWEYVPAHLEQAIDRLNRWQHGVARPTGPSADQLLEGVRARLADDLDAPGALQLIDAWADDAIASGGDDAGAPGLVRDLVGALLGVKLS